LLAIGHQFDRDNLFSFGQRADDRPQDTISNLLGRLGTRQPLEFALAFFQPAGLMSFHFQGKNLYLADNDFSIPQALFVGKGAQRSAPDPADYAGLFSGLRAADLWGGLPLVLLSQEIESQGRGLF
jgi:hypothetical protein